MNFKKTILYVAVAVAFVLQSCDGIKTTENGLKYKIIVDSTTGKNIELGGVAFFHFTYQNEKDTFDSKKANRGNPFPIKLPDSVITKGGLEEVLVFFSKGDSAMFQISSDSLYKNLLREPKPKEVKEGSITTFYVRIVDVLSKDSVKVLDAKREEAMLAAEKAREQQAIVDSAIIVDYCKKNKINAKRTPEGVYYSISKPMPGPTMQPGDTAYVFYTGKLLDGTKFDSNVGPGREAFPVVVGYEQVIPGWHSGLLAMKKGEKGVILIPSPLAYRERGSPGVIPPNAVLLFEMEIKK